MKRTKTRAPLPPEHPCRWCGQPTRRTECDACFDVTKRGMDRVTMATVTKHPSYDGGGSITRRAWNAAMGYSGKDSDAEDGGCDGL